MGLSSCNTILKNKFVSPAFFVLIIFVVTVEGSIHLLLNTDLLHYCTADEVIGSIDKVSKNQLIETVFLGDSVGRQIYNHGFFSELSHTVDLSTNTFVHVMGQYFILLKLFEKLETLPKQVIYLGLPILSQNFAHPMVDTYFTRQFTQNSEILEASMATKNPMLSIKMLLYRLLPSFKGHFAIQKYFGIGNPVWLGATPGDAKRIGNQSGHSWLNFLRSKFIHQNLAYEYFAKILALLEAKNIEFYYLAAPIYPGNGYQQGFQAQMSKQSFPYYQDRFKTFKYDLEYVVLESSSFTDGLHLNPSGLETVKKAKSKSWIRLVKPN